MRYDSRLRISCLHWVDRHCDDLTNTFEWVNGFAKDYYDKMIQWTGCGNSVAELVEWIDRAAIYHRVSVERICESICETSQPSPATRLGTIMEWRGVDAEHLAKISNVDVDKVSMYRNGNQKSLGPDTPWGIVERLAKALRVDPAELFERT